MGTDIVVFAGGCEEEEQDRDAAEEDGTADAVGARRCRQSTEDFGLKRLARPNAYSVPKG